MSRFYEGQRVRYVSHDADGVFCPPVNTLGTIKDVQEEQNVLWVEWDSGTEPGEWAAYTWDVTPLEDNNDNDA